MNRRSFFRDALLSFAAATALARTSVAVPNRPADGVWYAADDRYINCETGNDAWDGSWPVHIEDTNIGPWKTLSKASRDAGPCTLRISPGTYYTAGVIDLARYNGIECQGDCWIRNTRLTALAYPTSPLIAP